MAHVHPSSDGRATDRPALEVADIVRAHGEAFVRAHVLMPEQHAVLRAIARCRTAALGGHVDVCSACGHQEPSYNSCRNRHCPKCQALAQARWVEQRMDRMLPTGSFHAVFTLPSELHGLVKENRERLYALLLSTAAETLLVLGRDERHLGAELGVTTVLHTWTRTLLFHPHAHCIVTAGGLSLDGQRWIAARPDFLFPVRVLGALFRGKFLAGLKRAYERGQLRLEGSAARLDDHRAFAGLLDRLYRKRWVVYNKRPFGGPEQVFRYLGRYTHRVGLSNRRLVSFDERGVTFRTRGDTTESVTAEEFLRRFVQHVLPKGFVKIRHYGLFAASNVSTKLATARRLLTSAASAPKVHQGTPAPRDVCALLLALTGIDLSRCKRCGGGPLVRHALTPSTIDARGPPRPLDTS